MFFGHFCTPLFVKTITVPTTKLLRFAIFWEILENCQLKTLLNPIIRQIVTAF